MSSKPIKCKYFVYLLKSTVSNRTYIGFTVNHARRLRQHNGEISGGAKKTRKGRPWKLILYITGFEYEKTALQYEFCIQHHRKFMSVPKSSAGIKNKITIMKTFLRRERICSTAVPNSEMRLMVFFIDPEAKKIWNS